MASEISIQMGKYCVYTHSLDGEVFYVGKGLSARPFDSNGRNPAWHALVTGAGFFDVNIVSWHENEKEALATESTLIKKLKPLTNIGGGGGNIGFRSLIRRGDTRVPNSRNVARITNYGNVNDRDTFKELLHAHLGLLGKVAVESWIVPEDWVRAYGEYFHAVDRDYVRWRDERDGKYTEKPKGNPRTGGATTGGKAARRRGRLNRAKPTQIRVPCEANVARLTGGGEDRDWESFKISLQAALGLEINLDWKVPRGWESAYKRYFFGDPRRR